MGVSKLAAAWESAPSPGAASVRWAEASFVAGAGAGANPASRSMAARAELSSGSASLAVTLATTSLMPPSAPSDASSVESARRVRHSSSSAARSLPGGAGPLIRVTKNWRRSPRISSSSTLGSSPWSTLHAARWATSSKPRVSRPSTLAALMARSWIGAKAASEATAAAG